jgi:hypothetical protein
MMPSAHPHRICLPTSRLCRRHPSAPAARLPGKCIRPLSPPLFWSPKSPRAPRRSSVLLPQISQALPSPLFWSPKSPSSLPAPLF